MTIQGFDADALNKPINFPTAFAQGYRACYIKMGGNNLSGNAPYLMTSNGGYQGQVNAALAAGFIVGSYWMVGGHDPVGAADFYAAHRDPRTVLDVIDNEHIDAGNVWSDGEAAAFIDRLASKGLPGFSPWHYSNKSDWNAHAWPELQKRSVKCLVAFYNNAPFQNIAVNYPASLIFGHQYTSSASIGGLSAVDADAFTDDAFKTTPTPALITEEDDDMKSFLIYITNKNGSTQWAQISGDLKSFVPIWKSATANALSAHGPQTGPAIQVVAAEWNGYRAAAGLPADTTVG